MLCPACGKPNSDEHRFCSECGAALPICGHCGFHHEPTARYCGGCGRELIKPRKPERRQITVLFCDLVDSTALASSLELEDFRSLIQDYQIASAGVVASHNGFVANWVGDGVLAYFGYPTAQEDAAAQAVRAGLELVRAVETLKGYAGALKARVGIATGTVVVGDIAKGGMVLEAASISGASVNLAARLEAFAQPGTVVISDTTRKLLGNRFKFAELGSHTFKGFDEAVTVWGVEQAHSIDSFAQEAESRDLGRILGREQELAQLKQWWQQAVGGSKQLAIIRGEPGIGKSRLARALCGTARTTESNVWQFYCAPHFRNSALFPIIEYFQRIAGFAAGDAPAVKIGKLERLLARLDPNATLAIVLPFIADLLSIPVAAPYEPPSGSPEQRLERLLDTLVALMISAVKSRPSLIVFEDAQWMDATSLGLIERFISRADALPVLMLLTARTEFKPQWDRVHVMEVGRLDNAASVQLVQDVAGDATLTPDLVLQIVEKGDGIPLFLEEIAKAVLERRELEGKRLPTVTAGVPPFTVPDSLQDSLMSRLDRFEDAKRVVQLAAAIGRRFSFGLLAKVSNIPVAVLHGALKRLADADLISCQTGSDGMTCLFKHALVRDAAYATLLRVDKRALHGKIAEALQQDSQSAHEPELLAYHMTEANLPLQAIPLWQEAGARAAARAAHLEAANHFTAALHLLSQANLEDHLQWELILQTQLGLSMSASRGYAAPEVRSAYGRAREICTVLGNQAEHFPVLRGLCTFYIVRGELDTARDLAQQCFRIGEQSRRPEYLIEGCTALGYVLVFMGELTAGVSLLERAIETYESSNGHELVFQTAQDPCVACRSLLALVFWVQGRFEDASRYREQSLATATRLKRPFDFAYAACFAAMLDNIRGEPGSAAQMAAKAVELSREHGFGIWLIAGNMHASIAHGLLGDIKTAIDALTGSLEAWRKSGAELNRPYFLGLAAEFCGMAGRLDEALAMIDGAIEHARTHNEMLYAAMLHRIRGDVLLKRGDADAAHAALMTGLAISREQSAKAYEALISRSLHALSGKKERAEIGATGSRDAVQ